MRGRHTRNWRCGAYKYSLTNFTHENYKRDENKDCVQGVHLIVCMYMTPGRREYLTRKAAEYRAKKKNLNVVPVLAEPNCGVVPAATLKQGGEVRESTTERHSLEPSSALTEDSRGGVQTLIWDKDKYPDRKAWEMAV